MIFTATAGIWILYALVAGVLFTSLGYWLIQYRQFSLNLLVFVASIILTVMANRLLTVEIVEFTSSQHLEKFLSIGFGTFHASDGQVIDIVRTSGATLYVNSSDLNLYMLPLVYGNDSPEEATLIAVHTSALYTMEAEYTPDVVPPESMYVGNTYSEHFYWLATELQCEERFPEQNW